MPTITIDIVSDLRVVGFEAIAEALRVLGFSNVDTERVQDYHRHWTQGAIVKCPDFGIAANAFKTHPSVFGKPLA